MSTSPTTAADAQSTRRRAYRLVCECGETRIQELANEVIELVDATEYTCCFSEAQWDALQEVGESLCALRDALRVAHEHIEPLLVDARAQSHRGGPAALVAAQTIDVAVHGDFRGQRRAPALLADMGARLEAAIARNFEVARASRPV